jgi:uncharacterized membrane protein YdbT with pleckstrin-like domain
VGFPEDVLTDDEYIVVHTHPHWSRIAGPALAVPVVLLVAVLGVFFVPAWWVQHAIQYAIIGLGLVALIYLSVLPWSLWVTTRYVLTNERMMIREGLVNRTGRDIPLARIEDVSFQQTFLERLSGSGTLIVSGAGERGPLVLSSFPHVADVQATVYELAEQDAERRRAWG